MKARALNPRCEMSRSISTGVVSEFSWRVSLSSFIFQRNFSSPFCTASFVSLASVLTHDDCCASP